jgi:hypothetical protein
MKIGIDQFKLKDAYHQRQQNVDCIIKPACFHRLTSQFRRNLSQQQQNLKKEMEVYI